MAAQPVPFVFTAYPKVIQLWLLVLVGFVLAFFHWMSPTMVSERFMGTVWLLVLIFSVLALGIDLDVRATMELVGGFLLILILALWAQSKDILVLTWLLKFVRLHSFKMNLDAMMGVNLCFGVTWFATWAYCWLNRRWVVTQGRMERRVLGYKAEEQLISAPHAVSYKIPDILDSALTWRGGYIIVRKSGKQVRNIGICFNVKLLSRKINRFQALPTDDQKDAPEDPEDS